MVTSRVVLRSLSLSNACVNGDGEREDICTPEVQLEHLFNDEHFHLSRIMLNPWLIWSAIFNTARYLLSSTAESFCRLI